MFDARPIGIFDSGIGGLTVYSALRNALPHEDFIYLGDTARLPYGTKSRATVENYTLEAARFLQAREIKYLVVACNTVSAQALQALQRELPDMPYSGVISAGVETAVKASRNGRIALLATEGTVRSGVFGDMIQTLRPETQVQSLACNLLVALAEEGWRAGDVAEASVARYLSLLQPGYDTLVLGCTHFPLFYPVFARQCGASIALVDSAQAVAQSVAGLLASRGKLNPQRQAGREHFLVTDMPERFVRVGAQFLGRDIADKVDVADFSAQPLAKIAKPLHSPA